MPRELASSDGYDPDAPLPSYDLEEVGAEQAMNSDPLLRQGFELQDDPFEADAPLPSFPISERALGDYEDDVHEVSSVEDFEPPTANLAVGAAASHANEGLEDVLDEADFFATRGLYEDAKAILVEQLTRTPHHPLVLERLREVDTALDSSAGSQTIERSQLSKSQADDALDFDVAQSLGALDEMELPPGSVSLSAGNEVDVDQVFEKFRAGIRSQVSENDSATHYDLGVAYKEMGLIPDALNEFELAARDAQRECNCFAMIGMVYLEQGQLDRAVESYVRALSAADKTVEQEMNVYYDLGVVYEMKGKSQDALYYFQKIARRDPGYRDVSERLGALQPEPHHPPISSGSRAVGDQDEFDSVFDDLFEGGGQELALDFGLMVTRRSAPGTAFGVQGREPSATRAAAPARRTLVALTIPVADVTLDSACEPGRIASQAGPQVFGGVPAHSTAGKITIQLRAGHWQAACGIVRSRIVSGKPGKFHVMVSGSEARVAPGARLPCLDGLRAVAVLMVLLFHQGLLPFGWVGVQIFFVLSGYLITRLLVEARGERLRSYLRTFYGRRSLRIFPLYFAVILVCWLALSAGISLNGVAAGLPFAATYTYNLFHASSHFEHSKLITHFWSLCVEEQFYLVWPFLIYFCPSRRLRAVLSCVVLAGPVLRLGLFWLLSLPTLPVLRETEVALYVLTPTHFDAFAAGGFVALYVVPHARRALLVAASVVFVAGLLMLLSGLPGDPQHPLTWASLGYPLGMRAGYGFIWGYSLLNIASALLIDCVAQRRFLPRLFDSRVLSYLGKISYGLYVIHYPVQSLLVKALPRAPLGLQLLLQSVLTVALSSMSFYFWEERFSRLKYKYFPSGQRAKALELPTQPATKLLARGGGGGARRAAAHE